MKNKSLILVLIVLLASIFGVYKAFSIPTRIEEPIVVLNYEHIGEFDYVARQKASYLFGDIPFEATETVPESPPATPKYPAEIIDSIDMTFAYRFVPDKQAVDVSEQVEVRAVLEKPGIGREEVILVPTTKQTGDFAVDFSLDPNKLALTSITTINANVDVTVVTDTGPIFERFTQKLNIWSRGPLLEMDNDLNLTQRASFGELSYEQIGDFDYSVPLKPDSPFGAIVLKPPSPTRPTPPTPPSSKISGSEDTLFFRLLEEIDVSFSYHLESDLPVSQITEEVEINAILEDPGVWSKTFALIPLTQKSGDFTVTFPLDIDDLRHFNDVFRAIEDETGVSAAHNLTIKADVHTVARTPFGPLDEDFSQTLSTALEEDTIAWNEELVKSEPGVIERPLLVPNPYKFVGLSISWLRNLSAIVAGVVFMLFLYLLTMNVWFKPEELPIIEKEALQARKKYKSVMVDVQELPEAEDKAMVIQLGSLDELIKAADNLIKPVLHKAGAQSHIYCVIDGSTRYEYISEP